ncbi:hypothetical protein BBJ29_002525 [Phytophthora kernoviae]|uniref:GST N-terminal domain-containing protein n=1 Tax=Phytophthora kernoviae TaxID=325452 RepID=A0A3F2RQN1_9STRA|nr:hypothetical protein BBJ29_002525 [Phytophthora kernoviae]RLN62352.1 hypothetical protein BBP00_00004811 [Phytophthora kernoviae]
MTLKLYANFISQPSRAIIWALKVKGEDFELVEMVPGSELFHSYEFKAINPNQLVPVIKDEDFVLSEGMAIITYLADKFQWTDLYPKDVRARAKVNEFLHWHHTNTRLFTLNIHRPSLAKQDNRATPKDLAALDNMDALIEKELGLLETFLDKDYIAHTDAPTVADYAAYCEIDQLEMVGIDFSKYKKVSAWMDRMKKLPYHDEVHEPLDAFLTKKPHRSEANLLT